MGKYIRPPQWILGRNRIENLKFKRAVFICKRRLLWTTNYRQDSIPTFLLQFLCFIKAPMLLLHIENRYCIVWIGILSENARYPNNYSFIPIGISENVATIKYLRPISPLSRKEVRSKQWKFDYNSSFSYATPSLVNTERKRL